MTALQYLIYKRNHGNLVEKAIAQKELRNFGFTPAHFEAMDKLAIMEVKTGKVKQVPKKFELKVSMVADNTRSQTRFAPEKANAYNKVPNINHQKKHVQKPMNTLEKVNLGVGSFGLSWGAKTVLIESLEASGELCATAGKYLKFCKGVNIITGAAGIIYSAYGFRDKENPYQAHYLADVAIGIAGLVMTGGTAYIVGGTYFITDLGVQYYTGKSITEHLFD